MIILKQDSCGFSLIQYLHAHIRASLTDPLKTYNSLFPPLTTPNRCLKPLEEDKFYTAVAKENTTLSNILARRLQGQNIRPPLFWPEWPSFPATVVHSHRRHHRWPRLLPQWRGKILPPLCRPPSPARRHRKGPHIVAHTKEDVGHQKPLSGHHTANQRRQQGRWQGRILSGDGRSPSRCSSHRQAGEEADGGHWNHEYSVKVNLNQCTWSNFSEKRVKRRIILTNNETIPRILVTHATKTVHNQSTN